MRQVIFNVIDNGIKYMAQFEGSLHSPLRGKYLNYEQLPDKSSKTKEHPWIIPTSTRMEPAGGSI